MQGVSLASSDQESGPPNSTIDIYDITEKWGTVKCVMGRNLADVRVTSRQKLSTEVIYIVVQTFRYRLIRNHSA